MASVEVANPMNCNPDTVRPGANFEPSLWGDRFSSFYLDNEAYERYAKEVEVLKEVVRSMLIDAKSKATEKMNLINTLDRLGIFYHFEKEIDEQLKQIFHSHAQFENHEEYNDLNTAATHFRVFRQYGHKMPSDVFNKFRDSNGKFKENLTRDVMGMLSLYEAAFLRTHGEDILDEALAFTTAHLKSVDTDALCPFIAKQVIHALEQPLRKGIPRSEARHYISVYEECDSKNELLLKFAKYDFNLVQLLHKQELCHMSRWWKDLEFETKLPYARNRLVECYFWAMAAYFEPHYTVPRVMLAKVIVMSSVLDDTYDAYGTLEELKPFTEAIQRWDWSAMDDLPDYMQVFYRTLLNLYEEFDKEVSKDGRSYSVEGSKIAFKELSSSYYLEAKWYKEGYVPSYDEYMVNALKTAGYYLVTVSSYLGMRGIATAEIFDWVVKKPKVLVASCKVVRLMDDIVDYEEDLETGNVATGIICYMRQNPGKMTKEKVVDVFNKGVADAWKDINEESLKPNYISKHILRRSVNLTGLVDCFFKTSDGYTHPDKVWKYHVVSLYIDAIPI
ncbi:valerianol synthase TPS1B-like [Cornus florida]|uniref:valerianol synthase TPS1B-like n=1 Tax=Cornus florida TaxID=4283 RepID=UPI002898E484|nr:valerianol synthase TPS1B-like [Cornus florida]